LIHDSERYKIVLISSHHQVKVSKKDEMKKI